MSKLADEFRLDLSLEDATWACKEAVAAMGWDVESIEPNRPVTKKGIGVSRNPSKIEMLLSAAGPEATKVMLNGRINGRRPVPKATPDRRDESPPE